MDILFYGGHYWDRGAWFRKQQIASRLANRGHRVFYVEDSVSIIRRNSKHKNQRFQTKVEEIKSNLIIITPSAFLPFPFNKTTRHFSNLKLFYDLKKIFKKYRATNVMLWFNRLEFSTVLDKFRGIKVIDLCDDLPYYYKLFGNEKAFKLANYYLGKALSNTDLQVVSALRIKEKYQKFSKNEMFVMPNGHNLPIGNTEKLIKPREFENIKGPVIGFLGTLFKFIDDQLLEYIISNRPNYSFVFVGGVEHSFPIEKIDKYKNFMHLGKKPKSEIQNYINAFDICLNPFKKHEVNDSVSPVKVFEYLALKKHIVSTEMYSLMREEIADYIIFAKSNEEFLIKLDALVESKDFVNIVPDSIVQQYSWDSLIGKLFEQINKRCSITL